MLAAQAQPRALLARNELIRAMMPAVLIPRVCHALSREGITPMLLKGALFQRTLYHSASERPLSDVDVLVPEGTFVRAVQALVRAGFIAFPNRQGMHEVELRTPDLPIPVDLHRSLFGAARYALTTRQLFLRSRLDTTLYGVPLHVPAALDQLAHLIGHCASEHGPVEPKHARDLALLVAREGLRAEACAEHLDRCGLGRAARYALPELATAESAELVAHCLAQLRPDSLGEHIAQQARMIIRRHGRSFWGSVAMGHALNSSLQGSVKAVALAALHRVRFSRRASPSAPILT